SDLRPGAGRPAAQGRGQHPLAGRAQRDQQPRREGGGRQCRGRAALTAAAGVSLPPLKRLAGKKPEAGTGRRASVQERFPFPWCIASVPRVRRLIVRRTTKCPSLSFRAGLPASAGLKRELPDRTVLDGAGNATAAAQFLDCNGVVKWPCLFSEGRPWVVPKNDLRCHHQFVWMA